MKEAKELRLLNKLFSDLPRVTVLAHFDPSRVVQFQG
jgi:hypothetical protein